MKIYHNEYGYKFCQHSKFDTVLANGGVCPGKVSPPCVWCFGLHSRNSNCRQWIAALVLFLRNLSISLLETQGDEFGKDKQNQAVQAQGKDNGTDGCGPLSQ